MPFARKILYGLNKIKDIINSLISDHNTNKDAHSGGFNNLKLWSKYTNSTAPFTENAENISITANNYRIVDNDNKSIADFHANFHKSTSDGVTRLGTVAAMQARAINGNTVNSAYIAAYVSADGTKKTIYASPDTYLSYMYATYPLVSDHVANKKYVDDKTANLASNEYVAAAQAAASCPTGMIAYFYLHIEDAVKLYSTSVSNGKTIGSGWVVCDGRNYYNKHGTQTTAPNLIGYYLQGTKTNTELNQHLGAGLPAFDGTFTFSGGAHSHVITAHHWHAQDSGTEIWNLKAGAKRYTQTGTYDGSKFIDDGEHSHTVSVSYPTSSVYGKASTVQPATVRMIPMMKI